MMLPTLSVFVFSLPFLANGQSGFKPPHNHVNPDWEIKDNKISWSTNGFPNVQTCPPTPSGLVMQVNPENTYYGCCPKGQTFFGASHVTGFHCCSEGHELSGSPENGYECCPTDKIWDGKGCNIEKHPVPKPPKCEGEQIPDGHGGCKCPPGKRLTNSGCVLEPCSSGIVTGKCYMFTGENGKKLGFNGAYYANGDESIRFKHGKFQFCKDSQCTPDQAVNPDDKVYIRDRHGNPSSGANPLQWLNNKRDGPHTSKTGKFEEAGEFSITKWPCGKYCLGGYTYGLGPACPANEPAMTFYSKDPEACIPFELTEVPCDIHATANNCIWKNSPDQCCDGAIDCKTSKTTTI